MIFPQDNILESKDLIVESRQQEYTTIHNLGIKLEEVIESRRHDTPQFLSQCQNEILEILAQGNSISDIKQNKISYKLLCLTIRLRILLS